MHSGRSPASISLERIGRYEQIQNTGGRNGSIVAEVGRLAQLDPLSALHIAETREDPSLRVNCLAIVGRETHDIAPLVDARTITEGAEELNYSTRNDKLSRIALYSVGIDNTFAAETAQAIEWPSLRAECQDCLAVLLAPTFRQVLEEDRGEELAVYKDLVFRAFGLERNLTLGRPKIRTHWLRTSGIKGWDYLKWNDEGLDIIRHGGRYLETVSSNSNDFNRMIDLISSTRPS